MARLRSWIVASLALGAMVQTAVPASAASPAPGPSPAPAAGREVASPNVGIKAVVVKSWSNCGSTDLIWDQLNANWSSFGSIPISIDYSNPDLCGDSFTLSALEASGADVVILDDPAGGPHQYSAQEVSALEQFASEGHDLIGTYLTFRYKGFDDSALAPLFGLSASAGWKGGKKPVDPTYTIAKKTKPLFRNIPHPFVSTGFNYAQTPGDGTWSDDELAGARFAARTSNEKGAITLYLQGSYDAIYVSNMVEYGGGTDDQQFFYNAITYPMKGA